MDARKEFILFLSLSLLIAGCAKTTRQKLSEETTPGEFSIRMEMTLDRLTSDKYVPVFTSEFILADVKIDKENPRRFDNYSGDISGRYIEVMSHYLQEGDPGRLKELVKNLLEFQHNDGRFGDTSLVFTEQYIDRNHMPLLWGNGRLLTGLLEYYKQTTDREVLSAAQGLGDFFLNTYREVTPAVAKRLEGLGADGIICFTQYVEPLVMLSGITGDPKYAEAATRIYPVLPSRGILHSHGYLTTLRGILKLYEYDNNRDHFNFVLNAYSDLINSSDYTLYGSVMEYFGGKGDRDEGCSTADFIRLSLHLYKLTNDPLFLERAEFALYNSLYFNQYFTGDFGHHVINRNESAPTIHHMAWWCCTMAGLRAMQVIRDQYFVESSNGTVKINLCIDTDYMDENVSLMLRKGEIDGNYHTFDIVFSSKNQQEYRLLLRKPSYASEFELLLNGEKDNLILRDGYYVTENYIKEGDNLRVRISYNTKIITDDRKEVSLSEITGPVRGALCYGPYLMAVDNDVDYTFLAEPNNNVVYSNTIRIAAGTDISGRIPAGSFAGDAYLTAQYRHAGFPSYLQVLLRPVSEMTFNKHPYMMVSYQFMPE